MRTKSERGMVGWLLLVAFIVMAGWVGYTVGRLYFDHKTIENEVAVIADEALTGRNADVQEKVAQLLGYYGARFDRDNIKVDVVGNGGRLKIRVPYTRTANLLGAQQAVHFDLYVERDARKAVGILQSVQDSMEGSANTSAQKYLKAVQPPPTGP